MGSQLVTHIQAGIIISEAFVIQICRRVGAVRLLVEINRKEGRNDQPRARSPVNTVRNGGAFKVSGVEPKLVVVGNGQRLAEEPVNLVLDVAVCVVAVET